MMEAKRHSKLGLELSEGFEFDCSGNVVRVEEEKKESDKGKQESFKIDNEVWAESIQDIEQGMRCEVRHGTRRGSVAFVGKVAELGSGGYWVGLIFDEPVGKRDGTTKGGKRYFEEPGPAYGSFVRKKNIVVGDFPEIDIMDELDTDSDDEL